MPIAIYIYKHFKCFSSLLFQWHNGEIHFWRSIVTNFPIIIPVFKTIKLKAMVNIFMYMTANKKRP